MKYDFDKITDRRHTNSLKWDIKENELPMWVADMDFETAPQISGEIIKRAQHKVFGYNIVPDEWYEAYIGWWKKRHNFEIKKQWLIFCTGVVPAISSIVRKLTTPAENVLILTPVYNIFFNCILNNGRNALQCPLVYNGKNYDIDFADLEEKLSNPQTTMMILCNPQNPAGKIWDKQTLEKIGELCFKYNVIVISDEIHCDITKPGKNYIPFASVSEKCRLNSVTCIAPTKTFNIAGLQTAAVFAANEFLKNKVNRALNTDEVAEPNTFAVGAAVAAYTYGEEWLDELLEYIDENKRTAVLFIKENLPRLNVCDSEATYLLWIDCSALKKDKENLAQYIREKSGLYLSAGAPYGGDGENFLRLNVACPKKLLADGLERLKQSLKGM